MELWLFHAIFNALLGFLKCYTLRLELMHRPDLEDTEKHLNRTGYAHIAFRLDSREQLEELTQRLSEDGYSVISGPRTTGDGYYESCILAVEGNVIELTI